MLWGSEPLLFLHHLQRPSCCLATGKLRHKRIAVKLCPSRDCSASPPARALLQKPLSGTLLCGPARTCMSPHLALQPPASTLPGNLRQDQAVRRGSSPGQREFGCSAPVGQVLEGAPLCSGGILPPYCAYGAGPVPRFSPHSAPRGRSPGRQGHHVPLKAVGHSTFSHEQPRCAA